MTEYPTIKTARGSHQMSASEFSALRAIEVGYGRIDRRDGLALIWLGLAYHMSSGWFGLKDAGKELLYKPEWDGDL